MTNRAAPRARRAGDFPPALNGARGGWNQAMGIHFVSATADEVVAEMEVAEHHRQPYGIVHGGVRSRLIEAVPSVEAALPAQARSQAVLGPQKHSSFLPAWPEAKLRATAGTLTRGRRPD